MSARHVVADPPSSQAEKWAVAHKGGFDQSWYDQVENMGHSGGLVSLVEEADRCPFPPKNTTEELERKGITSFARYAQPWLLTRWVLRVAEEALG